MYIVVLLIMFGTIILALGFDSFTSLFDGYSLLLIVGIPVCLLYVSGVLIDVKRSFKILFAKENIYTIFELEKSLTGIKALQNYLILTGIFGTLIGFVSIMSDIDKISDPFEAMSVASITTLYAVILYLFASPINYKIQKLIVEEREKGNREE